MILDTLQLTALQRFQEGKNLFITGSAGTGKSLLVKHLIQHYSKNHNPQDMVLTSTTGISSLNIGGKTIHSFSGLRPDTDLNDHQTFLTHLNRNNNLVNQWRYTRVLVIDEISMLSPEILDFLNTIAQQIRNNALPFGGIQLVLTGDFFQLPPVQDGDTQFAFEAKCWKSIIDHSIVLDQVHRQRDADFINFLNQIRIGELTLECQPQLQKYIGNPNYSKDYTHLFANRLEVDRHNMTQLDALPGKIQKHQALMTPKNKNLEYNFPKDTCIAEQLLLKPGAFVIINKNLDFDKGLVNGRQATFIGYSDQQLKLQTNEGRIHHIGKAQWEFTSYFIDQYPICLAWALTIHKSQGMGIARLSVDIGSNIFDAGQAYVALSRACDGEHLHISHYHPHAIKSHPKVKDFYQRLNRNRHKYFKRVQEDGSLHFQNKLTGAIETQLPHGAKLIKTPTPLTSTITHKQQDISIKKHDDTLCIECQQHPYLKDYFDFLDERVCQSCVQQDRKYQLLTKTDLQNQLDDQLNKTQLNNILKNSLYKPQPNAFNPRFAPTRLYLLKHIQQAIRELSQSPKQTPSVTVCLDPNRIGKEEVISIRKNNLQQFGYDSLMDWLRDPNHIYISRNMTVYIPGALQSKWNNPFTVKKYGEIDSLKHYKTWVTTGQNPITNKRRKEGPLLKDIHELQGKILGCWCKPGPCHGDVLLECLRDYQASEK